MNHQLSLSAFFSSLILTLAIAPSMIAQSGARDPSFDASLGSQVLSLAPLRDGKVLVGTTDGLVRLKSDGTTDGGFDAPTLDWVSALSVLADGKVLAGGGVQVQQGYLVRLKSSGALDDGFAPVLPNGTVASVGRQADGAIVLGGYFTLIENQLHMNLARVSANGALDTSFNAGTDPFGVVSEVAVQRDGKILVVGYFSAINGEPRSNVARLLPDGSLDPAFDATAGTDTGLLAVAVQDDGKILIGGGFATCNGVARTAVARLNSDGTLDASFMPALVDNPNVRAIAIQDDGKVLIGGGFYAVGNVARDMLARLHADGSLDTGFQPNLCCSNEDVVNVIAPAAGDRILVGGSFTFVDGAPEPYLTRLMAEPDAIEIAAAAFTGTEGRDAIVTLRRTGNLRQDASVVFSTGGGTATPGLDYKAVVKRVDFHRDQATRTVKIELKRDHVVEGPETVGLALSNPSANVVLGRSAAVLTIVDG